MRTSTNKHNILKKLIKEEIRNILREANNELSDWDTVYTWAKLFSTDTGNFLSKNNITSGVWLKKAIEAGKITLQDIDNVTRESDGVKFSELPMVKTLTNNTISETNSSEPESWKNQYLKVKKNIKSF